MHLYVKGYYPLRVRIEIVPSARRHRITDAEIRSTIVYPQLRLAIAARRAGTQPYFYTAPTADNRPWIEVIADLIDPTVAVAFHAMMLRPSVVTSLGIAHLIAPEYGRQRT